MKDGKGRGGVRAYARHRGVSHPAVINAVKTGRIPVEKDGKIDFAKADAAWRNNTDLTKPKNSVNGDPHRKRQPIDPLGEQAPDSPETAPTDPVRGFARSRAAREGYAALLAKLDYETRTGALIPKDQVRAQEFIVGRRIRDHLLTIADRVAAQVTALAPEADRAEVHRLIDTEVRLALEELQQDRPEDA